MADLLVLALGLTPSRVHLIDAYPRDRPVNFLFRGNNPVSGGVFNLTEVRAVVRTKAASECGVALPASFSLLDLDLENPTDPGYFAERAFWGDHPELGALEAWPTLGSVIEAKHTPASVRAALVSNGSWAVQGHADHLHERLNRTRAALLNTSGAPTVLFVHCNAGCDRTGEFVAAYALSVLGYNITTAYGEACKQCGRCPNYYATQAIAWWCLTERAARGAAVGDCLDFEGCKFLGDCDAHGATPLADDCPRVAPQELVEGSSSEPAEGGSSGASPRDGANALSV